MSKMILIFEENLLDEIPDDVDYIYAYSERVVSNYSGQAEIFYYNIWESSESEEPRKAIEKFLTNGTNEVQIIKNTIYSNWVAPIHSMLSQINRIIKEKSIGELILVKGSKHVFSTFELAEGEGNPVLYKNSWLFNPVIQQYYSETGIRVTWKKCNNFVALYRLLNCCREHVIRVHEIITQLYRCIKAEKKGNHIYSKNGANAVCFANLKGQYDFLKAYLNNKPDIVPVIVTPKSFDSECVVIKGTVNIKKVIKNLCISYRAMRRDYADFLFMDNKKIYIDQHALRAALITELFIYRNEIDRVINSYEKLGNQSIAYMITCMSQGRSMVKYTEAAKRLNLKHINYQYVSLGKRYFPILDLADEYYVYEVGSYTFYKEKSDVFRFYLPQLNSEQNNVESRIVIYTQPDRYIDLYLRFIKSFLQHEAKLNQQFQIIIKLHYRQNRKEDFEAFRAFENVSVITNEYSVIELMNLSTFCISMTSSVLSEATFYKVPAFIYIEDSELLQFVVQSGIGYPEINYIVRSVDELCEKIQSFDKKEYQNRYNSFLLKY